MCCVHIGAEITRPHLQEKPVTVNQHQLSGAVGKCICECGNKIKGHKLN